MLGLCDDRYIHIYIYVYLKPGSKAPCAGIGCRCSAGRRSNGWTLAGSCIDCTQPQAAATSGIDLQPYEISILIEHCAKENPWLPVLCPRKQDVPHLWHGLQSLQGVASAGTPIQ